MDSIFLGRRRRAAVAAIDLREHSDEVVAGGKVAKVEVVEPVATRLDGWHDPVRVTFVHARN
jgi:hypothetical protein